MARIPVIALTTLFVSTFSSALHADAIPYFARQYNLGCNACHASPPKLNAAGEDFRRTGYRLPDRDRQSTVPLAVWVSGRSEHLSASEIAEIKSFVNRVEFISGGNLGTDWFSYFVEWRTVSLDHRVDGTLYDRSGRFEDIFVTMERDNLEVMIGQFRQIDQVDVSVRPGLSEPIAFSASLSWFGEGTDRQQSLRSFAPSARSPAVRLSRTETFQNDWDWTTSITLPVPGEFSLPLTHDARVHASNEFELTPKGVVVESFARQGVNSWGGHIFFRGADYFLANAVMTGVYGPAHWTAVAGIDRAGYQIRSRWSLEGLYIVNRLAAFGGRFEQRTADGRPPAIIPYINVHFPGSRYTLRLTIEQRVQRRRNATFLEVAAIF